MTSDRTSATTTYVMCREEHLWNTNAPKEYTLPFMLRQYIYYYVKYGTCTLKDSHRYIAYL
jgi:hypothetical protein